MANFHTGTTVSPESQPATTESPVRPRDIIFLICWLLACGGLVFWRSFHVSYSFDDVAHLHALAAYRSGEISLTQFLLHNHNEHFLPLVRLYFMAATKISGLSSASMHVFLFLNYVAGAFACAWIAFSLTRSRLASFLAGTIFVGAAGFIGSMLWQPSDGEFSVAGTPLIFAIAILVSPYTRKRWTDVAVLGLVFVAALGLGSITVPALAIPIYVFLAKPYTMSPGRRKGFIVVSVLLIAAILIITKWLMMTHQTRVLQFAFKGIIDGLLLIFFSAGRFLVAWTPFVEFDLPVDIAFSAVGWALILATLRWVPKPLRQLLAALWAGSGLLALLIGMGRWKIATYYRSFRHRPLPLCFSLAAGASDRGRSDPPDSSDVASCESRTQTNYPRRLGMCRPGCVDHESHSIWQTSNVVFHRSIPARIPRREGAGKDYSEEGRDAAPSFS